MSPQADNPELPQRIHFVGIAGIGLSAIARVLAMRGHDVRGSDMRSSAVTVELEALGVHTYLGHAAEQVGDAELLVVSSAMSADNTQGLAAQARGIPVVHRREMLGRLLAGREGIAVAGTHGKTTTTSMTTLILHHAGLAPSFVVGGIIRELGLNAEAGSGRQFVIEADEYDRAFLGLRPNIAVVTNIEMDHPDCYRDLDEMRDTFGAFLEGVSPAGLIVACADSPQLMRMLVGRSWAAPRVVTYGLAHGADYRLADLRPNVQGGVTASIYRQDGLWAEVSLPYPGAHTALDATAAMLAAERVGVPPEQAAQALAHYGGVLRRFEVKGEAAGITVVDDYAHHPTEVQATLAAARARYGARRLWVVLQPHTYSRVQALFEAFCGSLVEADQVIVTDVYAARACERPQEGYDAADLVAAIRRCFPEEQVRYTPTLDEATCVLEAELVTGDVLLTLGAGDGYLVGERVLAYLRGRSA